MSAPRPAAQRAAVKISSVRLNKGGKSRAQAHAKYLQRDGAGRDGEPAAAYGKDVDEADLDAFNERCEDDRHQFRVILSPEAGHDLELSDYARDVMEQVEEDLDTDLDWVAVNHHNTDNPHIHLIIRGVDDKGDDLVINRDYICHGFRARACEVATRHLGPRTQEQVDQARERSVEAERYTGLDRDLLRRADERGVIDLRSDNTQDASPDASRRRSQRLRRAAKLEALGLAKPVEQNVWKLDERLEEELRDLSRQKDIIRRMYAAKRTDPSRWSLDASAEPVVGRLVDRGLADEHDGHEYLVVDGADGRVHHLESPNASPDTNRARVGDIVEFSSPDGATPTVERLGGRRLDQQVAYEGPTWLDKELVQDNQQVSREGFGKELRAALDARRDQLEEWGLTDADGRVPRDVIKPLRARERAVLLSREAARLDKRPVELDAGDRLRGRVSEPVELNGGTYHVIEGDRRVAVLPSNKYLRQHAGKHANVSMRRTEDGRVRPFVRPVDPNNEMER